MSDAVVGLRLIKVNGEVIDLKGRGREKGGEAEELVVDHSLGSCELSPDTLLEAARMSAGLLGIITQVTLQCEPSYFVRRQVSTLKVHELSERIETMLETYRHVWALWHVGQASPCSAHLSPTTHFLDA